MKKSELKKLIKECLKETLEDQPPSDWESGFAPMNNDSGLKLMNGEKPFQIHGKWYLYVWDRQAKDQAVYDFSSDMAIPYNEFQQQIGVQEGKKKGISQDEKNRRAARRKAEIESGVTKKVGGAIPSKKDKKENPKRQRKEKGWKKYL